MNMIPETTVRSVRRSLPLPRSRSICQRAIALALVIVITSTAFTSQGFPFCTRFGSSQAKRTDVRDDFEVTALAPSTHANLKEETVPLKLNAAVVHYCGGEQYTNIAKLSHENIKRYVARHGLELYVANSTTFPTEAFFNPKAWLKLAFTLQILNFHKHDWLLWLDCDSLIRNMDTSFEDVFDTLGVAQQHEIVVAKDIGESPFNTGVMFIKNSEWSKQTLSRALRLAGDTQVKEHPWWEQRALHILYNENKHSERTKLMIIEDRWRMNAFEGLMEERNTSFVWHRPNCREKPRCDDLFRKKFCEIHGSQCVD